MKVPILRFGWLEYYSKKRKAIKILKFCFGALFLHSRAIAYYLFNSLSFDNKNTILDIGSGDGNFANWISYHSGAEVVGVERLSHRVKISKKTAEKHGTNTRFICKDIEKEKVNFDCKFDKIIILDCLEHLRNPQSMIEKSFSWLKKGGVLFISTPYFKQNRFFLDSYQEEFAYGEDQHHYDGFSKKQLNNWLKEAGFKKNEVRYTFYKIYQFTWEISEKMRRSKLLYSLFIPFFHLMFVLDRKFKPGNKGNGLICIAKK